jgi:hypothetical protein
MLVADALVDRVLRFNVNGAGDMPENPSAFIDLPSG